MSNNSYLQPLYRNAPVLQDLPEDTNKNGGFKVTLNSVNSYTDTVTVPTSARVMTVIWGSGAPVVYRMKSTDQTLNAALTDQDFRDVVTESAPVSTRGLNKSHITSSTEDNDKTTTSVSFLADGTTDSVVYVTFE